MVKLIKTRYYIFLIFALCVVSACSEDYLDVESHKPVSKEITSSDAEKLVNAVYNIFLNWNMSSFSWIGVTSITSDNAEKGSDPGDTGRDKDLLDNFSFTASTLVFTEIWEEHYKGVQRANQALSRIVAFEEINNDLQTRLIGEIKFLRALIYFRLAKCFGGVPLIVGINNLDKDVNEVLKRASLEDTYEFIEKDLEDAIAKLPKKSEYQATQIGRATQGAAKALLAKVSMYQKKWQRVWDLTDEIIKSNEYSLTPDYKDIWREVGENNDESIFEIQAVGGVPAAGVDKYCLVQNPRGEGGWGWGFNTPTEDLVGSYEVGDVRKDATIIFRGETLFDGRLIPTTVENSMYNQKAYSSEFTTAEQTGKNIRILRYAEVLLMNSEAALHVGQDAGTSLKLVRNRAGLDDGNPTMTNIWIERRHELAFEHDRFFDLVRQGRAGEVLRSAGIPFIDGKNELFPIPQQQIDKSSGILIQNPNY